MRYYKQNIFKNKNKAYKRFLKDRGMTEITQYDTPKFRHPSVSEIAGFNTVNHIWTFGDHYYKLAEQYYSDPTKWWVIAFFNQKPTEFHVNFGDVIYIPTPLESVMYYLGY